MIIQGIVGLLAAGITLLIDYGLSSSYFLRRRRGLEGSVPGQSLSRGFPGYEVIVANPYFHALLYRSRPSEPQTFFPFSAQKARPGQMLARHGTSLWHCLLPQSVRSF